MGSCRPLQSCFDQLRRPQTPAFSNRCQQKNGFKNTLVQRVKSLQEEGEETQTYKRVDAPNLPPHSKDLARSFVFYWKPSFCYTMEPELLSLTIPVCLEDVRIKGIPQSAFYISDFISVAEEQVLLNKVGTLFWSITGADQGRSKRPRSLDGNSCRNGDCKYGPPTLARTTPFSKVPCQNGS